ncbi:hypothetical protein cypCar_00016976 [Cyprinus carpio]|nr:hypothetical protein cypCar_00016976 [Cyprinus carpio]
MGKWPQLLQRVRNLMFHSPYLYCQMDFHPVPHKFLHSLLNDKLPQTKTSPGSAASKFHGTKCQHDCYRQWKKVAWLTQRTEGFFVRINPEEGTKCTAKFGTSRKTGGTVQRKVATINSRVATFLQRLTEFEWKTAN